MICVLTVIRKLYIDSQLQEKHASKSVGSTSKQDGEDGASEPINITGRQEQALANYYNPPGSHASSSAALNLKSVKTKSEESSANPNGEAEVKGALPVGNLRNQSIRDRNYAHYRSMAAAHGVSDDDLMPVPG